MELFELNSAYALAQTLYDVSPSEDEFIDMAYVALSAINNKHTRIYRYVADTDADGKLELPCDASVIESVHIPMKDAQMTSNQTVFNYLDTLFVEGYIDAWKRLEDPTWTRGKLVKYTEGDNCLYFARPYRNVMVVYHAQLKDSENGLPLINDKEQRAIATFVAYTVLYKEGLRKRDGNIIQLAQTLWPEWLRLCNAARIPDNVSQNDMDQVLNAATSWDRKTYGKSFKPIK